MSKSLAVSFVILATGIASTATGQIAGDAYFITPAIGTAATGFAFSMGGAVDSTIDDAAEVVGTTIGAGMAPVTSSDMLMDNGGGNFTLTLRISSTADLTPGGFAIGGVPATQAGVFCGANAGADPINLTNAALVNTADLFVLDLAGAVLAGPIDISGFANFANPAFGGGWDGSFGVVFGPGSAGPGLGGFEVVINYDEGPCLGTFTNSGIGCPAALPVSLSADSAPTIGATTVITASDLPASTIAAILLFGTPPGTPAPLDGIGATGCTLFVSGIFIDIGMALAGTDATIPLSIPNNPVTIGLTLDLQAAAAAPGVNPIGLVFSDLGTFKVGG